MNGFVRSETLLTKLQLSQGKIQTSIHNSKSHKGYFLSYWPSIKSITAGLDTWEYNQTPVSLKVLSRHLFIWKYFPDICLLENKAFFFVFCFFVPLLCFVVYFYIFFFYTEFPLLSVIILQVLSLQSRVLHCRQEIKFRKAIFSLNVWYTAAYFRSRKKMLQSEY